MPNHFLLSRMTGTCNHELERSDVLFIESLEFADKDVPRVHKAKQMPVTFHFECPVSPVRGASKGVRIANLDIKVALVLVHSVGCNEIEQKRIGIFCGKHIYVGAQETAIQEKLQRSGA